MDTKFTGLRRILASPEYRQASERAAGLKKAIEGASDFRLNSLIAEAQSFFADLRQRNPTIYSIMSVQEKEIAELAFRKRTGHEIVIG